MAGLHRFRLFFVPEVVGDHQHASLAQRIAQLVRGRSEAHDGGAFTVCRRLSVPCSSSLTDTIKVTPGVLSSR